MEPITDTSLGEYIGAVAERCRNATAVEYMSETWTYSEMWHRSTEIAKGMVALGIGCGTHVGIWANDRPNTLFCMLALLRIGAVCVMLSTSLPKADLERRLSDTDTEYLLYDCGYRDVDFAAVCAEIDCIAEEKMYSIDTAPPEGRKSLKQLVDIGSAISDNILKICESKVTADRPDFLLFTSGSTSAPKAVQTTHFARLNTALHQASCLEGDGSDRYCISMPMFHCFSLTGTVLAALCTGARVCFPENRRTDTLVTLIEKSRCTIFSGVPTLFSAILAREDFPSRDLSSLRTGMIGGAGYPPDLFIEICDRFGYTLLSSLGQTEATAGFTSSFLSDSIQIRSRTVGRFWGSIEGKIADPRSGDPAAQGSIGEIHIRGFNVMECYYGDPLLTSQVKTTDGWLKTGDLAYADAEGNLHLAGRLKELIIRGGENISPGEIELALARHHAIDLVKVIGVPDSHYGEEVCAIVVAKENTDSESLRDFLCNKLEYFKIPRHIIFTDSLPMTAGGKIDISACRDLALKIIHNGE